MPVTATYHVIDILNQFRRTISFKYSLYILWNQSKQIKISSFLHRIQTHERVHSKSRAKKDDAHYQADSYQIIRLHGFTMLDFAKINISTNKAKL